MNNKNVLTIILLLTSVIISSSDICSQIIENDGIFYRNFTLNPDTNKLLPEAFIPGKNTSGDPIEPPYFRNDFMVNILGGDYGCDQTRVRTAMDGSGNYAFTWIDKRNDKVEIFAQFFDSYGNRVGNNFKVNENTLYGNNSPFIAVNNNGDFVITWLQSFSDVIAQRFTNTGQKVGGNIIVNTISAWNTMEPCAAVDNDGSFMIMWASEPGNWDYTVYARLFDNSGTALGTDIYVSEPGKDLSSIGERKSIAVDNEGNYCLTWSSYGSTTESGIYAQMINRFGQLIGNNKIVSDPAIAANKIFPSISSTDEGNFLIAWNIYDSPIVPGSIGVRIYNKNNSFITGEIYFGDQNISFSSVNISSDRDSIFYVLLEGYGIEYLQKIKSSGEFIGDTVSVSYNYSGSNYMYANDMTNIVNNKFYIATIGYQLNDANVYAQEFDTNILPVGTLEKIHDDIGSAPQRKPLVKFNNNGQSIVLWEDRRNGRYDLYAQIYDQNFNPVSQNIRISEVNTEYWFLHSKEVQSFSDGTFIIAYTGSDQYYNDMVWLQLVSLDGEKIGNNVQVTEPVYDQQYELAMNVNSNDELLLCWYNRYGSYSQVFDMNLNTLSAEKNFMKYSFAQGFRPYTISVDADFNVFAAWEYFDFFNYSSGNQIFGEFFDRNGEPVTTPFLIDSTTRSVMEIKCKSDGNENYVLVYKDDYSFYIKRKYHLDNTYTYTDRIDNYSYYPASMNILQFDNNKLFITYNNLYNVMGYYINDNRHFKENYSLHHYEYLNQFDDYNGINGADFYNNKLIFTFESSRNSGTSSDIWTNVRTIEDINFNHEFFYSEVNSDYLYENYPNPFNNITKIPYQVLSYDKVKLTVYDILGREVKVLVDEYKEKGIYEIEFDASGLASGVYFYKFEAFDTIIKKMILVK